MKLAYLILQMKIDKIRLEKERQNKKDMFSGQKNKSLILSNGGNVNEN